jgi:F0F1-type ATP synthase assembly protein I
MKQAGIPLFRPFGRDLSNKAPTPPLGDRSSRLQERQRHHRDLARFSGFGLEFALTVGLMGWLGWWLDQSLGIADVFPAFLLLGVLLGVGLGIYRMDYQLKALDQNSKRSDADSEGPSSQA